MDLIIDRQTWLHQEGPGAGILYRSSDGKSCCLGFYCRALGISNDVLENKAEPNDIDHVLLRKFTRGSWLIDKEPNGEYGNSIDAMRLMAENDRLEISEFSSQEEIENGITVLFAAHDVHVTFVN